MKATYVTLQVTSGAMRDFDIETAERLLRMRVSGWALPKDSDYQFKNGNLERKSKKGNR